MIVPSPQWKGSIEELSAKDVPNGKTFQIIETSKVPSDRYFRAAWKKGLGEINIDMPKARDVHMGQIRRARDKRLKKYDIDWMKAREQRDDVLAAQIANKKQVLRDLPQTFDLSTATTPENLKALWPVEINEEI